MGQLVYNLVATLFGFFFGPIAALISGIIGGILAGLSMLALMAGDLAHVFSNETDQQDKRDGPGLSWFTHANLEGENQQIMNVLTLDGGTGAFGGSAFGAFSVIGGLLTGGIMGFTKSVLSIMTGGGSFGIAMAVTVIAGSAILGQQAQGYLNQEEADLA
ncbi:MAG: hypothetical protein ABI234_07440 [Ktedonobacteraceae bacterium]